MNPLSYLSAIACIIFLYCAVRLFRLAPWRTVNRVAALLNVLLALWGFDAVFSYGLDDPAINRVFYLAFSFCWCLFSGFSLHLALRITGISPSRTRMGRVLGMVGLYGPGVAFTFITNFYLLRGFLWRGGYYMPDLRTDWVFLSYAGYYVIYNLAAVFLLFRGLRSNPGRNARRRLGLITASIVTALSLGFVTDTIFPIFGVNFPNMAILWITIWSMGILVAISRYDFLAPFPVSDAYRILDAMADIVIHLDDGGTATWLNASARRFLGIERDTDPPQATLSTLVEFQTHDQKAAATVFAGSSESLTTLALIGPSKAQAAVKLIPLRVRNALKGVVLVASDLSDAHGRERAERMLAEAGFVLDQFIERSHDGIMLADHEGKIVRWNPAMEHMTGMPVGEAVGKQLCALVAELAGKAGGNPARDAETFAHAIREVLSSDKSRGPIEIRTVDGSGTQRILLFTNFLIPLKSGARSAGIVRDVTEERRAAEENLERIRKLDHAQKMEAIGTLTGGIAHDFNNTLGGIVGAVSLMRHGIEENVYATPADMFGEVETIERSALRASKTVGRLLAITKKRPVETKPTSLGEIAQRVVEFARRGVDRTVTIDFDPGKTDAVVRIDASQVEQLILNLIINAAHAMTTMRAPGERKGGTVRLSIGAFRPDARFLAVSPDARPVEYRTIVVRDEGVGIPAEVIPRIFDPFFTTKNPESSSGLGLAMVHSIAKQHGGFVEVESEPGKGSEFRVYFPAHDGATAAEPEAKPAIRKGHGRVLVAEDEGNLRNSDAAILRALGYEPTLAENGERALDVFTEAPSSFRALVLDIAMPVRNGKETMKAVREISPDIPIVLTSGFTDDDTLDTLERDKSSAFLPKPFTIVDLSRTLSSLLENR